MLKSLNHILGEVENQPEWQGPQQFQLLLNVWSQVVGAAMAQQTRPSSISRDVLYVAASSSVWVQELKFKRRSILKKLNAQLPSPFTDIRFSTTQWIKDAATDNWGAKLASTLCQEHPSQVVETPSDEKPEETAQLTDSDSAFQNWAQMMQARSLSFPLCPQCQCPSPPGELQRWNVCCLCAAKQWQR